jgi:NADPH2:quinone reductase
VIASAANPVEAKIRASGTWARIPLPAVIGYDAAGLVDAVGPGVTDFAPGDEVFYTPEVFGNPAGTHAEYNVVHAHVVAKKPPSLSFAEAASLPLAGGTAYEGIVRRLAVRVGETVLIHGGAGGVGSLAIQIAKASGARVIATAGTRNQEFLRELGADVSIDYATEDVSSVVRRETRQQGVDATFDCVGGELAAKSVPLTRVFGRIATILPPKGDFAPLYVRNQALHGVFLTRERPRLEALARMVELGQLKPIVDLELPLERIREAHERLDSGHGRGKIVVRVSEP